MSFQDAPALPAWLAPHFPVRRRVAEVDGQRIHFVDEGEGRPVLLLHGNPTWSFLWRKVIARLADEPLRLIAPDLVGLGLSSKPRSLAAHSLEAHAGWIGALVDRLELDGFTAVGQDWGGPIAATVAARRAERVRGLVFANTAALRPRRPLRPTAFHRFSQMPVVSDLAFRVGGFPLQVLHRTQGDPASIGALERRAYRWPLRRIAERAAPLALARMVPDREGHPTLAVLEETDAYLRAHRGPAALVWGRRDPILGRGLKRMREALPAASVTETDAGHFLQEEVPDELARAIREVTR